MLEGEFAAVSLVAPLPGDEDGHDDQQDGGQDAGAKAAQEQAADGCIGGDTVHHHGDAGGDQDAKAAGGRD